MNYASGLRCIAQDLERRGLKSFDLRVKNERYFVACGYQEAPAATPVSLVYTAAEIRELDRAGAARRSAIQRNADFFDPVQIFRAIGAYLDRNEARLLRLTNNDAATAGFFKIEYLTRAGERVVEDRAGAALYDMCVQMYKRRRELAGAVGRGASPADTAAGKLAGTSTGRN